MRRRARASSSASPRRRRTRSPTRVAKRIAKGADWIVANDVSGAVMGGDANTVHLVSAAGIEDWPPLAKAVVARRLAARIAAALRMAVAPA